MPLVFAAPLDLHRTLDELVALRHLLSRRRESGALTAASTCTSAKLERPASSDLSAGAGELERHQYAHARLGSCQS